MNLVHTPSISSGSSIEIRKDVRTILRCPNPGCQKDIDVTNLNFGINIKCEHCENVTWVPEFKKRWWFRLRNFIVTIFLTFILGFSSSFVASFIYNNSHKIFINNSTVGQNKENIE